MRRKIYSLVLLAVGLLIGTNVWANLPQRPTPPMEPKALEGVEMVKPEMPTPTDKIVVPAHKENASPKFGADINAANIVKAPRKAVMAVENTNVAKIGETEYPTLAAAIDAYQEGVITLIADVTESVEITKDIQINCDTYTLTNTESDDYVIKVSNNANVTLVGNYPSTLICAGGKSLQVEDGASVKVFGELAFANPSFVGSVILQGGVFTVTDYEKTFKSFVDLDLYKPICGYYPNLTETEPCVCVTIKSATSPAKAVYTNDIEYEFTSFNNAKYFVKEGGTITLLTEYWGTMTLDKNLTLDLNGNTLYYYYAWYVLYIENNANVTIKNGDILTYHYQYLTNDDSWSGSNAYAVYVKGGSVSFDNVRISSYSALYSSAPAREKGPYYGVYIYDGSVAMTDSQVDAYAYGIFNYGTSVTLTNNDIYSKNYGVYLNDGSLTYNSGKILAEGKYGLILYAYYGAINATIEDGVFENTDSAGWPLYVYGSPYAAKATINGGYFKGAGFDVYNYAYGVSGSFIKIYGGTFYKSANTKIFGGGAYSLYGGRYDDKDGLGIDLPAGYSFGKGVADGKYGKIVYPLIQAKASTAGYGFASVEEALADVDFDGTVKLIANVENATINKNATLDLDIYSVTGTLTVTDGIKVDVKSYDKGNIHDIVATKEDVILYGGNYDFLPSSKATIAEGLDLIERPNYPSEGKYTLCKERVAYIVNAPEDTTYYWTLQEAINAAGKGDTILLKKDFSILDGVEIKSGQEVVIDLNGHVVTGQRNPTGDWQLVNVRDGKLTLMDNTDVNKDGTGTGKLSTANFSSADVSFNPTYTVNLIRNAGTLIIESGLYETFGLGQAAYSIDQHGGSTTINGGKVITLSTSFAIRIFFPSSLNNKFYINGGVIGSLWVQSGSAFTLHIQDATILRNLGIDATTTNFDILLKNVVMASDWTLTGDARSAYAERKYVVDSVRISGYNLQGNLGENAFQHLKNGQYQFEDAYMGNENASSWKKYYSEEEGYYAVPIPSNPSVVQVYKTGQANVRAFMPYIMDGYGLVCIDEENKWYEVRPLQGTTDTQDVEGRDGELGNPWHQNKTWSLEETEKDITPVDTTAVLIDHNVYVEENTQAVAASLQIEAGQTLTVKSGATLQIQDAGALFKDETAKLVIEPEAVVTVGSNGVIADNVDNIIIEASATEVGNFLLHPNVVLNTKPDATVRMVANVGKSGNDYTWHRFAMPVEKLETPWTKKPAYGTLLYEWSYSKGDWDQTAGGSTGMKPFLGYTITTQQPVTDVEYTFTGQLLGNNPSQIDFQQLGYGYFGNSYTGYILAKEMLNGFKDVEGIEGQVWMWNAAQQSYTGVSLRDLWEHENRLEDYEKEVAPMQTFILKTNTGLGATINIDYMKAIWGNPRYGLVEEPTAAPARYNAENEDNVFAKIMITAANGQSDEVRLTENDANEDAYENSVDATKYFNKNHINIYASVEGEDYTSLYTNNLLDKEITLQTQNEVAYTLSVGYAEGGKYALQDMLTGAIIPLEQGTTYNFAAQSNTTSKRFRVVEARKVVTDIDNVEASRSAKGIYTVLGQYVGETSMFNTLPAGVYVIDGVKIIK